MPEFTYPEVLDFLYKQLPMYQRVGAAAYKANLDTSRALDQYFGAPHRAFRSIHVAGTNGKGSVSHMLASVLQSKGYQTGLYTSPHLLDFRERIRVGGEPLARDWVVDFMRSHWSAIEQWNPSFFEISVAMAFLYFRDMKVDVAVVETGMGGRLDSTNLITPLLSVITNIGLDHTRFLGDSRGLIAGEKAGIIKKGIPVILGQTDEEILPVFAAKARKEGSSLVVAPDRYTVSLAGHSENSLEFALLNRENGQERKIETDLCGEYQSENLVTAVTALDELSEKLKLTDVHLYEGLRQVSQATGLQGRWQLVQKEPLVVLDTAHNKEGLSWVIRQIQGTPHRQLHVVLGLVKDKNIADILSLFPAGGKYYFTQAALPRAIEGEELLMAASAAGLKGKCITPVEKAFLAALSAAGPQDLVFVGGSTFVVAETLQSIESSRSAC